MEARDRGCINFALPLFFALLVVRLFTHVVPLLRWFLLFVWFGLFLCASSFARRVLWFVSGRIEPAPATVCFCELCTFANFSTIPTTSGGLDAIPDLGCWWCCTVGSVGAVDFADCLRFCTGVWFLTQRNKENAIKAQRYPSKHSISLLSICLQTRVLISTAGK